MNKVQRMGERLPRFYKHWQKDSLISSFFRAMGIQLDKVEEEITDLMKAHWVDTAKGDELDKLGIIVKSRRIAEENDAYFRTRLKRAVNEYKGGGTLSTILEAVKALIGAKSEKDIKIVENPPVDTYAEFLVIAGDTWILGSNSIADEQPKLTLTVEGEGQVSNPQIMNTDTGESITFKGKLKSGEQLVIEENKASLDEKDVTADVFPPKPLRLPRKGSTWKYSEALLEQIGVFDTARFDEHTFAVGVPTVRIRFDWVRYQPATFLVEIESKALGESGVTESYVKGVLDSMKGAGVNAIIQVLVGD
jgi:hypothetical protein